mmetsp:Transcript_21849/g.55909  ORF Transcript_21849/g.55909 Transcript_21849/m.55909 type:complete len:86 (+) Transcript_21849:940-1197(+)
MAGAAAEARGCQTLQTLRLASRMADDAVPLKHGTGHPLIRRCHCLVACSSRRISASIEAKHSGTRRAEDSFAWVEQVCCLVIRPV